MKIQAVRYFDNGFYSQPMVMGGEGKEGLDPDVRYRGSLQNYVIDTGDEVILVDTALPKEFPQPAFDPAGPAYFGTWVKDYVSALADLGYTPDMVDKICLTHKHADHSGELRSFPRATVFCSRAETQTDEVKQAIAGGAHVVGVDFKDGPYHNFEASEIIAPHVRMVPAPGHTLGNSIVIIEEDDHFVMIHGDISYVDEALYANRLSVVFDDIEEARRTQEAVRAFIRNNPTVYCGTHTPQGPENLEARRIMDLDNPPKTIWPDLAAMRPAEGTGKWVCSVCGYVYDPAVGDPDHGIPAGTAFEDLPDDWRCPRCMQPKDKFTRA